MSGRAKGDSKLSKFLDRLFERKYLSFWVPVATAFVIYILFLMFGENSDKRELIVQAPLFALLWFAGVFLVLGVQLINSFCTVKAMDYFTIILAVYAVWAAAVSILGFLIDVQNGFSHSSLATIITWSAVSLIHNLRR